MKRGTNEHGIIWPSSKKLKQCHDEEPNTDCYLEKPSKRAGLEKEVSKGAAAIMTTVENPPSEFLKESNIHAKVHLDGVNQLNIAQPNGSYEGDLVWIDFSFTSSFDQLIELICKKFRLELDKFKIKYLDVDKEWLLMTCLSDLTHALLHNSSSGRKSIRLSITDMVIPES